MSWMKSSNNISSEINLQMTPGTQASFSQSHPHRTCVNPSVKGGATPTRYRYRGQRNLLLRFSHPVVLVLTVLLKLSGLKRVKKQKPPLFRRSRFETRLRNLICALPAAPSSRWELRLTSWGENLMLALCMFLLSVHVGLEAAWPSKVRSVMVWR